MDVGGQLQDQKHVSKFTSKFHVHVQTLIYVHVPFLASNQMGDWSDTLERSRHYRPQVPLQLQVKSFTSKRSQERMGVRLHERSQARMHAHTHTHSCTCDRIQAVHV